MMPAPNKKLSPETMSTVSDNAFRLLKGDLTKIANRGELKGLLAYLRTERYTTLYAQLTPKRQLDLHDHTHAAKVACTKQQEKPIPKYSKRGWRSWDAERIAKLKAAEAKYGTDEGIARELGISLGAARMARWRHIGGRGHKPFVSYATVMSKAA